MSDNKDLKNEVVEPESKSFDDAELEDIMNEIEELEKDFSQTKDGGITDELSEGLGISSADIVDEKDLSVDKDSIQQTELQEVIDQEVEGILDEAIASAPEPVMEVEPEPVMEVEEEPVMEAEPEPVMEAEPEPVMEVEEEPVMEAEPEPVMEVEEEPVMEIDSEPGASDISARDEALEAIENKIVDFESHCEVETNKTELSASPAETHMNFSVSGQMRLKLNFEVSGQVIELSVDQENGFVIEMGGGVRFSVPVEDSIKKAS